MEEKKPANAEIGTNSGIDHFYLNWNCDKCNKHHKSDLKITDGKFLLCCTNCNSKHRFTLK